MSYSVPRREVDTSRNWCAAAQRPGARRRIVEREGLLGGERGVGELPGDPCELGVVLDPDRAGQRGGGARRATVAGLRELELEAERRDRAQVGPHGHRRLALLDPVQRHARHVRGLGQLDRRHAERAAMMPEARAERRELRRRCLAATWRSRWHRISL